MPQSFHHRNCRASSASHIFDSSDIAYFRLLAPMASSSSSPQTRPTNTGSSTPQRTQKRSAESALTQDRPETRQKPIGTSEATTETEEQWKLGLGNLTVGPYLVRCASPRHFNYPDFLVWAQGSKMTRVEALTHWNTAITFMRTSGSLLVTQAADRLAAELCEGGYQDFEDSVFKDQEINDLLHQRRADLAEEIDRRIVERQRAWFQESDDDKSSDFGSPNR
ncbi:hypothetical protein BGZ52_011077, partial [Haplosporangium bisporale]